MYVENVASECSSYGCVLNAKDGGGKGPSRIFSCVAIRTGPFSEIGLQGCGDSFEMRGVSHDAPPALISKGLYVEKYRACQGFVKFCWRRKT